MKQLRQIWWLRLSMIAVCLLASTSLRAQTTTEFLSQDFTTGEKQFPPENWQFGGESSSWFWTPQGYGEDNGSAVINLRERQTDFLSTPTMDVSQFTEGEVTLEFDLWMESNENHRETGWNDHLYIWSQVGKSRIDIQEYVTSKNFTREVKGSFEGITSNKDEWRHITLTLPADVLSSEMSINFSGGYDGEESYANIAIDNIYVIGTKNKKYSYDPKQINFGSIEVGEPSIVRYVTLKNPGTAPLAVSAIRIEGSSPEAFVVTESIESIPGGSEDKPGEARIGVRFLAPRFGDQQAELRFFVDADSDQDGYVQLVGRGALAEISVNGARNLFSRTRTQLGSYRDTTFVITNRSQLGKLRISPNSFIDGEYASQYSIVRLPVDPIEPGDSATVTVRYHPNTEGARWATLFLVSNAGNGTQQIELRGIGILQRFAVTPVSHYFDSVALGAKECKTFLLSNPGSDTLRLEGIYFSSADNDFTLTNLADDQMWIAPERSREITVCFEPRRMGSRQANLRILTNIPRTFESNSRDTSEFNVPISGTGVPFGELTLEDIDIDSGAVGERFCTSHTIMNVGDYSITVTNAVITGPDAADFEFQNVSFPIILQPGSQTEITICTTPAARGLRRASIVAYTTSNSEKDTVRLPVDVYGSTTCAQASASSLFVDELVLVGETATQTFTIKNCGDVAAVYTASLPAAESRYEIVGASVSSLVAPGASYEFSVRFSPMDRGLMSSNLTVIAEGVSPMSIMLGGTGAGVTATNAAFTVPSTAVGASNTFTVTVTNSGNIEWATGTPLVSGAAFSTSSIGTTIAPGASAEFTFTFAPTIAGSNVGTVTFPNAEPLESPAYSISLNGLGVTASVGKSSSMNGFVLDQNYPNPLSSSTAVRFTTPATAVVTITIVDLTGVVVQTIPAATYSAGEHTVEIDAVAIPAGTYYFVLSSEGVNLARQMSIVR